MKKKLLILIIPFLLTGCASVNYDLEINSDLEIEEIVSITGTTEYFNNFYKNLPITIVREFYEDEETMKPLKDNNYSYELVTENVNYPTLVARKTYSSLSEYTNNTVFKGQSFENIVTSVDGDLVTIQTVNFLPYLEDEDNARYSISNVDFTIKLPFVATENNADSYDPKTNTYTWTINKDTKEKQITLTFDKTRTYVYNLAMYISIFILCLLVAILIFVGVKMVKKNKINNKIRG